MTTCLNKQDYSYGMDYRPHAHLSLRIIAVLVLLAGSLCHTLCAQATTTNSSVLPTNFATDNSGNVYYADTASSAVYKMAPSGVTTIVPCCAQISASLSNPRSVAVAQSGDLFISDTGNNRIVQINSQGTSSIFQTGNLTLNNPSGIAIDGTGNIYVADAGDNRVIRVDPSGQASIINTGEYGLSNPLGVSTDQSGSLYISDTGNNRILRINSSNSPYVFASGIEAPTTVTMDTSGAAYIAQTDSILPQSTTLQSPSVPGGNPAVLVAVDTPSITITPNGQSIVQPSTVSITLTPLNGFNKTLSLSVLGLPPNSVGSFTPQTVTFDGNSSVVEKFSFGIINPGQQIYLTRDNPRQQLMHRLEHVSALAGIVPFSCLLLFGIGTKRREWRQWCKALNAVILVISSAILASTISGCAGGSPSALDSTYSVTLIATTPGSTTAYQLGSFQINQR